MLRFLFLDTEADSPAKRGDGHAHAILFAALSPDSFNLHGGNASAQVRFPIARQTLLRPLRPQPELATTGTASGNHYRRGAVTQCVLDKRRWQHPDAGQAERNRVCIGQTVDPRPLVAAEDHDRGVRLGTRQLMPQTGAQLVDGCLRQVNPGNQLFAAAKWCRRWAGTDADATTGTQVSVDLRHLPARHAANVRDHCHGGIRTVIETAPATVAVRRIHYRDR